MWRVEEQPPRRGEVVIFNRSLYEDVIVVRVHDLVPKKTWSQRDEQINDFERRIVANVAHTIYLLGVADHHVESADMLDQIVGLVEKVAEIEAEMSADGVLEAAG